MDEWTLVCSHDDDDSEEKTTHKKKKSSALYKQRTSSSADACFPLSLSLSHPAMLFIDILTSFFRVLGIL
jgi:hypothetical protein